MDHIVVKTHPYPIVMCLGCGKRTHFYPGADLRRISPTWSSPLPAGRMLAREHAKCASQKPAKEKDPGTCPQCGGATVSGLGFAAGIFGPYVCCTELDCTYVRQEA